MRPYGTHKQLQERRQQALKLVEQGKTVKAVAVRMKVSARSVRRWRQEQKHPKKKSARLPGKPSYLSNNEIKQLERELLKGAYAHGYSEDYWTLDRTRDLDIVQGAVCVQRRLASVGSDGLELSKNPALSDPAQRRNDCELESARLAKDKKSGAR